MQNQNRRSYGRRNLPPDGKLPPLSHSKSEGNGAKKKPAVITEEDVYAAVARTERPVNSLNAAYLTYVTRENLMIRERRAKEQLEYQRQRAASTSMFSVKSLSTDGSRGIYQGAGGNPAVMDRLSRRQKQQPKKKNLPRTLDPIGDSGKKGKVAYGLSMRSREVPEFEQEDLSDFLIIAGQGERSIPEPTRTQYTGKTRLSKGKLQKLETMTLVERANLAKSSPSIPKTERFSGPKLGTYGKRYQ